MRDGLSRLEYALLKRFWPSGDAGYMDGSAYAATSKIEILLGSGIWDAIRDRRVLDFGCGAGSEAVEMAVRGAAHVTGCDIQKELLVRAEATAAERGISDRTHFTARPSGHFDVITAIDSFEHFADPAPVLRSMRRLLADEGQVLVAFGPTWYHPLGGHLFSVFPWSHLILSERALVRWRQDFKSDGAQSFGEVAGGLNKMTISRFERLVGESPLRLTELECRPIRCLRWAAVRATREFTTAIVRGRLEPLP